jgi:hypothetical protein
MNVAPTSCDCNPSSYPYYDGISTQQSFGSKSSRD